MEDDIGPMDFSGVDSSQARDMLERRLIEIGRRSPTKAECTDAPTVRYSCTAAGAVFAERDGRLFVLEQRSVADMWALLPEVPSVKAGELPRCKCGCYGDNGHTPDCPHYVTRPPSAQCQGCSDPLHRHGVPF